MNGMTLEISINETQVKRLKFLINTFHTLDENGNDEKSVGGVALQKAIEGVMNQALHKYYQEVLGNINQGNEHDGLPLIQEI